jgi:hypothetical protein
MASPEYNIETLVIAILRAHATLSAVDCEHHSEDADTGAKKNRINVKCDPKTPLVSGRSWSAPVPVWQAEIQIEALGALAETVWDGWRQAIDEAMMPASGSYPAGVVTSAMAAFPLGLEIDNATSGGQFDSGEKRRSLTRTFRAVFQT